MCWTVVELVSALHALNAVNMDRCTTWWRKTTFTNIVKRLAHKP